IFAFEDGEIILPFFRPQCKDYFSRRAMRTGVGRRRGGKRMSRVREARPANNCVAPFITAYAPTADLI
ncbi:MAG: hypothetical protein K5855_01270, partial [Oscillospiraceae bacterium]|nr:hypothetical protein [Oscillospiraceae bacterium]